MANLSKQKLKIISLLAGVVVALLFYFLNPFNVDAGAVKVLAVAGLMITWWVTEALPMPVVALLPLMLFPLLKIASMEEAAAPYANPVIFLFMGGFMLGLAIEKWNLHRRIALNIIRLTGTSGDRIVLGFILATGLLSMWLSNTATTMMMFPIALSVIHVMKENNKGDGKYCQFFPYHHAGHCLCIQYSAVLPPSLVRRPMWLMLAISKKNILTMLTLLTGC